MQAVANARGIRLRPHAKTHKSPRVARWQIERGAVGICCAKLGEAEVFADALRPGSGQAGLPDIRIPYPLHPSNAERLIALLDRTHLSFIVDHPVVARQWSDAMASAGKQVDVLVKVDVGFHRCGIEAAAKDSVEMIRAVASLPGLRFKGLLSHAGHAYHAHSEDDVANDGGGRGIDHHARGSPTGAGRPVSTIEEISAGATPPARFSLQQEGFTEYRPGNYVYFDRTQVSLGAATFDDCALFVLAMVVSKPAADRLILDSGSKTLTNDGARGFSKTPGFGTVVGHPNLLIERLSEEHATVRVHEGETRLEPGDRVRIIPNHSCVVSNLVDEAWLLSGNSAEPFPIVARGRIT